MDVMRGSGANKPLAEAAHAKRRLSDALCSSSSQSRQCGLTTITVRFKQMNLNVVPLEAASAEATLEGIMRLSQ